MEQDVDDEDDDNNIEMPVETLVRETLWSNDFEVVEEAMQELYERILGDDESLKYLVALGTHAIVIRAMERFEAELAEPSGIYLSSGVLCFMFILFRVHKDEDLYVDPVLAASGLLSMVKVVQAHSNNLQIVKTGMDAMFNIFGASEAILDDGPNAIYLVQPMIKQGVIQLTVEFMKKFLELVDESSEGPLTVALMNLHIFLFYGGPRTIDILAQEIGVVKDDDDNDKTCSGFGVVLEMMNALPDVKMIQYYGCVVLTLNPQTGVYRERLRQLGAIDAISSAASFPDEEVREVATDALAAFKDSEHV